MAVTKPQRLVALQFELQEKYNELSRCLDGRPLKSATEGCGRGSWMHWEELRYVDDMKIRLLSASFKAVLAELQRLK